MRHYTRTLAALLALAILISFVRLPRAAAQTQTKTHVVDIVHDAGGNPLTGKITFLLTQKATTGQEGLVVASPSVSATLDSLGHFDVWLYPSASLSPASYYQVYVTTGAGNQTFIGVYSIPASSTLVTLAPNRVMDASLAAQYTFADQASVTGLTNKVVQTILPSLSESSSAVVSQKPISAPSYQGNGAGLVGVVSAGPGGSSSSGSLSLVADSGNTGADLPIAGIIGGQTQFSQHPGKPLTAANGFQGNIYVTSEETGGSKLLGGCEGYYNGSNGDGKYYVGRALSADCINYERDSEQPFLKPTLSWEGTIVHGPWPVSVGRKRLIYYGAGTSNPGLSIGVLVSANGGRTFRRYGTAPIIPKTPGTPYAGGASFPTVLYDEADADASKRFKMWFGCTPTGGVDDEAVCYAWSADGFNYTVRSTPVLSGSAGSSWAKYSVLPGSINRDGQTYMLGVAAKDASGGAGFYQSGIVTFTNPDSTYTLPVSPAIARQSTKSAALTANTSTGSATVTVGSTSAFSADEFVLLGDADSAPQLDQIVSINSSTSLTLRDPAKADYTTTQSAQLRGVTYASNQVRSVVRDGDDYLATVTVFQQFADGGRLTELSAYATASSPGGPWAFDLSLGVSLEWGGVWDTVSAENFVAVPRRLLRPQSDAGRVYLVVDRASDQAIPAGSTFTTVNWTGAPQNTRGMWSAASPGIISIKETGWYQIVCQGYGDAGPGVLWTVTGKITRPDTTVLFIGPGKGDEDFLMSPVFYLNAGETLEIQLRHTSGSDAHVTGNGVGSVYASLIKLGM